MLGQSRIQVVDSAIVPIETVMEKAIKRGFYKKPMTEVTMGYLTEEKILIWIFTNPSIIYRRNKSDRERLIYNAHTGAFIRLDSITEYAID